MFHPNDSIWLVSGILGVGKSTIAREIAGQLPKSAHIEVDLIRRMIVSGSLGPGQDPLPESDAQLVLGAHNAALLADSLMTAGFTPVVDDVVLQLQLARYRKILSRWPIRLVVLAPPVEIAIERDRDRTEKHVADRFAYLDVELRKQMHGLGLWLDTSGMSVQETVEAIILRADEGMLSPIL